MADDEKCHCGQPLHYTVAWVRTYVESQIRKLGPDVKVTNGEGRQFLVSRHYIALHGLKEQEVAGLGFPEITKGYN